MKENRQRDNRRTEAVRRKSTGSEERLTKENTRAKTRCKYSGRCGGCAMIDLPMDEQIKRKQEMVQECIGAYGPVEPVIRMKNPDRYRNKVTSVFALDNKRRPACGVYRMGTHELIPVQNCLLENKRADAVVRMIFSMLPRYGLKVYDEDTGFGLVRAVQVRSAHGGRNLMVTIVTSSARFPKAQYFVEELTKAFPEIVTVVQNINERSTSMILGEREKVLFGDGYVEDTLLGKRFRISSRSFYQVNPVQTEKLYNIAIDCAGLTGKELVLDAYCGIGTIGICASEKCREVMAVEINGDAVRCAAVNAKLNGADNVSVYEDDAGRFMEKLADDGTAPDVVFLDPPRSGATQQFLDAIIRLMPQKIVYISCNPVTLGENLSVLTQSGYRMKKAVPVDMFPYTGHIETVCLLTHS